MTKINDLNIGSIKKMKIQYLKAIIKEGVENISSLIKEERKYKSLFSNIFLINRTLFLMKLSQYLQFMIIDSMINRKIELFYNTLEYVLIK